MPICAVLDCWSEWYPGCDRIFHSFPSDRQLRTEWLTIMPLKKTFTPSDRICNLHFKFSDYCSNGKTLKKGITPFYGDNTEQAFNESGTSLVVPCQAEPSKENYPRSKKQMDNMTSKDEKQTQTLEFQEKLLFKLIHNKNAVTDKVIYVDKSIQTKQKNPVNKSIQTKRKIFINKSCQARIKSSREITLEKRNRYLKQKLLRWEKRAK